MGVRESWNAAIGLRGPTLAALEAALGHRERRPLFPWASGRLFLGGGFVAVLPIGDEPTDGAPVISVQLVLDRGYYGGPLAERFARAPPVTMLGLALPVSAQQALAHLGGELARATGAGVPLQLESTSKEHVLRIGQALSLYFRPLEGATSPTPEESRLLAIEYCYQLDYQCGIPPSLG